MANTCVYLNRPFIIQVNTPMKILPAVLFFILTVLNLPAFAATTEDGSARPGPDGDRRQWCADNPQKCEALKTRMQEKCAQDPKRCEEMQARRAERQAWCDANPEACQKKREEMKARRDEMRSKCESDPEACRQKTRGSPPAPGGMSE